MKTVVKYFDPQGRYVEYVRPDRPDDWLPHQDELIIKYAQAGKSAGEIADILGVSRNAISGRAHRIKKKLGVASIWKYGIGHRPTAEKSFPPGRSPKEVMARRMAAGFKPTFGRKARTLPPEVIGEPPPSRAVSLARLREGECHWPYGTGPYCFCGHPQLKGHPYCAYHDRQSIDWTKMRKYA